MGLWDMIFGSSDEDGDGGKTDTKVKQLKSDNDKVTADKYTSTKEDRKSGKHEHRSYNQDKSPPGKYKEYYGGKNAHDRSYNKKK